MGSEEYHGDAQPVSDVVAWRNRRTTAMSARGWPDQFVVCRSIIEQSSYTEVRRFPIRDRWTMTNLSVARTPSKFEFRRKVDSAQEPGSR